MERSDAIAEHRSFDLHAAEALCAVEMLDQLVKLVRRDVEKLAIYALDRKALVPFYRTDEAETLMDLAGAATGIQQAIDRAMVDIEPILRRLLVEDAERQKQRSVLKIQ